MAADAARLGNLVVRDLHRLTGSTIISDVWGIVKVALCLSQDLTEDRSLRHIRT
jgi:hypothetical protein